MTRPTATIRQNLTDCMHMPSIDELKDHLPVSVTPQRYRASLILFAVGILASAALIASQMTEGNTTNALSTSAAQDSVPFEEWANQDPAPDEHKGKLLGQVERDGQMVEVREAGPEDRPEPAEDTSAEYDAEQDELAPQ